MASIMNHTRAVRREDLAREADDQTGGNPSRRRDDGFEYEEALAARAALDAYMKDTLGLQFDVPPPRSAPPKPAASVAEEKKSEKDNGNKDDESDESKDSSDDEAKDNESEYKDAKSQNTGGATEFAFRLFSGSGKAAATAQNTDDSSAPNSSTDTTAVPVPIVLLDDGDGSDLLGPGGILNSPRPLSFYLAGEPTPEVLEQYAQATVSGEDIVKASRETRAWGWEVPWRARTVLKASSKTAMRDLLANALSPDAAAALPENLPVAIASATNALPVWAASSQSPEPTNPLPLLRLPDDTLATKHSRPGKRRRIILRKREQERQEKAAKAAAQAQSKEEHLSEKKKRLNRIKKLRRREKKRAEKGAGGDEGGDGGDDSGDSGGD
ncbi:hypothetical protein Sste5346_008907 [Sporothrix stenoceras]|uniref:Uncharacterized protein n=1 Tax=Sporothrix stenoceras TaxID=5173 RepID=A0ABR3YNG5_9PEZI